MDKIFNDDRTMGYLGTAFEKGYESEEFSRIFREVNDIETLKRENHCVCYLQQWTDKNKNLEMYDLHVKTIPLGKNLSQDKRVLFQTLTSEKIFGDRFRKSLKELTNGYMSSMGYPEKIYRVVLTKRG